MLSAFIAIVSTSIAVIWSIIFLITSMFGCRLQKVSGTKLRAFYPKVKCASVWTEEDSPDQWIMGKWFIGYIYTQQIQNNGEQKILYLFTSEKWYKKEIQLDSKGEKDKTTKITLCDRSGPYWQPKWQYMPMKLPTWVPYPIQNKVINAILEDYKKKDSSRTLLYGPPRSGKSNIPELLARTMLESKMYDEIVLVNPYKPSNPNDDFFDLYLRVNPTEKKPLIVVLEEVDGLIWNMHHKKIEEHKFFPRQVTCKADWNLWFDRMDKGYYNHMILIMTTNMPKEWFDELDPSYMGEGRVNLKFHFPKLKAKNNK